MQEARQLRDTEERGMGFVTEKIKLKGIFNARDMGGFPVGEKRVKPGRLIRSDALRGLTYEDVIVLTEKHGLRNVIDLRTEKEIGEKPDPDIEGVTLYNVPLIRSGPAAHKVDKEKPMAQLFLESIQEMNYDAAGAMKRMYENLLVDDYSIAALKKCFDIFLGCTEGSTLFHCTAGKDRTGLITILFLDALGADREDIASDYLVTNEYLRPQTEWISKEISKYLDDPKLIEQVNELNSVYPEYTEAIFAKIDSLGGSRTYLKETLGLSEEDLEELERLYLE